MFVTYKTELFCHCAASAVTSSSTSPATINCSIVLDVEYGATVNFPCNSTCISGNVILWKYYNDSKVAIPKVMYNGYGLDPEWLSRDITVNNNHASSVPSVLHIENVTKSHAGIYECHGGNDFDSNNGCKMRFCLTTGKYSGR